MAFQQSPEIAVDALRETLQVILSERLGRRQRVVQLRRRRSAYASSCPITNLSVVLEGGRTFDLVFKDLSPASELPTAREIRPHFLFDPLREIAVYRDLLDPKRWNTPVCYGVVEASELGQFWIFLERVSGPMLWQMGRLGPWKDGARWLAEFHDELAASPFTAQRGAKAARLLRYDRDFFELWRRRSEKAVARRRRLAAPTRRQFRRLVDQYDRVIGHLAAMPATVLHGEFYPSNVMLRRAGCGRRICPLDWELCGVGPGALDLAALSSGKWPESSKLQMIGAYREALANGASRPSLAELTEMVKRCQLHLCLQMLGWAPDWSPPKGHSQDWLRESLRLGNELGL